MFPPGLVCFWGGSVEHYYQVVGSSTHLSKPFIGFPTDLQPSDRPVAHSITELHAINLLLPVQYNLPSLPFYRIEMHVSVHFKHLIFFLAGVLFH